MSPKVSPNMSRPYITNQKQIVHSKQKSCFSVILHLILLNFAAFYHDNNLTTIQTDTLGPPLVQNECFLTYVVLKAHFHTFCAPFLRYSGPCLSLGEGLKKIPFCANNSIQDICIRFLIGSYSWLYRVLYIEKCRL